MSGLFHIRESPDCLGFIDAAGAHRLVRLEARRAPDDALSLRAGYDPAFGEYVLDSGRTIELPKFAFSYSAHGKGALSRNFHDWARQWQMPNGRAVHSEAVGKVVTGDALMTLGVPFALKGDYDSLVLVLKEPTALNTEKT